ncbi:MAG: carboxypeptidase regulatory-like domain-containing protein [Thermoanaerobaculia bacterium]
MTDEEGRYQAPDPSVPSWLTAWHPEFAVFETERQTIRGTKRSLEISMKAGVALRGRVVGSDRKSGVGNATIYVDGWPLGKSGEDGTFEILHASGSWKEISASTADRYGVRTRGSDGPVTVVLSTPATISGIATDARSNRPLAGAEVVLSAERFESPSDISVFTDNKGGFRFPRLVPGAFSISVRLRGYDTAGTSVSLRPSEQLTKNVQARPLGQISGSVLDDDKRPVPAARVAYQNSRTRVPVLVTRRGAFALSAPDGRFILHDVPVDNDGRLEAETSERPRVESDTVRLAAAEKKSGVILTIPRGIAVAGSVRDRDGRAVPGASIEFNEAEESGGRMMMVMPLDESTSPRSDKDGHFSVSLKAGRYVLLVRAEGFAPRRLPAIAVEPGIEPLDVVLDPGVEIQGRVVRSDGSGVEGASVSAFSPGTGFMMATSAPDGSFTLVDLAPGPMQVTAMLGESTRAARQSVVAPARDVVIEIPRGGTVRGRVIDKASGGPVTDFQIHVSGVRSGAGMLMAGPGTRRDFHTEDGTFVMEGIPVGPADITVTAAGYARGRVPGLRIEEATPLVDVEIALEAGGRLVGRVTGPDGSPIDGASITRATANQGLVPPGLRNEPTAQSDANGDYVLDSLDAGEQKFDFEKSGYVSQTKSVNVSGREARLDVRLSRGMTLSGTVTASDGMPVAGADVRASSAGVNTSYGDARSDAQGNFKLEGIAPGRYQVRISMRGFASRTLPDVDVETAGHLRVTLDRGGVIYGTVRGLPPEEMASVVVSAATKDGGARASADAAGNYRLEGVAEGSANVSAIVRSGAGGKTSPSKNVEVTAGVEHLVDIEFPAGTTITGRVTRAGRSETNATVAFIPKSPAVQARASASVDQQGNYSVSGLEDGEYTVRVINMQRLTPYTTRYEVRGPGTFDIDMRGGTLRGRVVDEGTGEGIVEAQITLQPVDIEGETFLTSLTAVSDASGDFVVEMIAPGRYTARAQKASLGHEAVDIEINDSDSNVVELKLRKEAGLTIRALDARSGRSIEAWVTVRDAGNRVVFDNAPAGGRDADGAVRVPVSAGSYSITVVAYGYASQRIRAQAPSQEIRVALTPGGSIAIESSYAERRAIRLIDTAGADYLEDVDFYGGGRLNPGKSTMPNIAPGAYTLQILGPGGQVEKSVSVTVREGQVTEVRI